MATVEKRLYRNPEKGIVAGVLAGVADYTGVDVTLVRIIYILGMFVSGVFPLALAYVLAWAIMPVKGAKSKAGDGVAEAEVVEKVKEKAKVVTEEVKKKAKDTDVNAAAKIVLIVLGVLILLTFLPSLIGVVMGGVVAVVAISTMAVPFQGLLLTSIGLGLFTAIVFISMMVALGVALLSNGGKDKKVGGMLGASMVALLLLAVATVVTGGIWCGTVGRKGIEQTVNVVRDAADDWVDVREDRVKVDIGPIHLDIR